MNADFSLSSSFTNLTVRERTPRYATNLPNDNATEFKVTQGTKLGAQVTFSPSLYFSFRLLI